VQSAVPPDMVVACRRGQVPFNDAIGAKCEGLLAQIFQKIVTSANLTYTMDIVEGDIDPLLTSNATSSAKYDLVIAYHTVTPDRLKLFEFSTVVLHSTDSVSLLPKYKKTSSGTLSGSVVRASVFYVFSIVTLFVAVTGFIIFVAEMLDVNSPIHEVPRWRKLLWAAEMAFEIVLQGMTSERLSAQMSRTIGKVGAMASIFVMAVFGAVITSQLTASSLGSTTIDVKELRGRVIAIASETLIGYLESTSVGARTTMVVNLETFATDWYNGKYPAVDGIASSTEVLQYIHNDRKGDDKGFVMSLPYKPTGTYALKAFPMSYGLKREVKDKFNFALGVMRDSGVLASMTDKILGSGTANDDLSDIPLEPQAQVALMSSNLILWGIILLFSAGIGLRSLYRYKKKDAKGVCEGSAGVEPSNEEEVAPFPRLVWRGEGYGVKTEELQKMIDSFIPIMVSAIAASREDVIYSQALPPDDNHHNTQSIS
jgi:ABC-type amino acid transport substrate-binding protein